MADGESGARKPKKLCIYAKGDSFDRLHTMVGLVSTAASMGWEAHVYMTYGVLWRYCHETMSEAEVEIRTPEVKALFVKGIDAGRIPDLDELFEEARELGQGRVKIYACTTSIKLLQMDSKLLEGFDGLLGHASFLQIAEGGQLVVT
jgi:peroxiredoxin family protein